MLENTKPLDEKTILERHTIDGKFNLASALCELEAREKTIKFRLEKLEQAMEYCSEVFKSLERDRSKNIILPDKPEFKVVENKPTWQENNSYNV